MDKQTTLGLLLIGAVLVIWFYINAPNPQQQQQQQQPVSKADSAAVQKPAEKPAGAPASTAEPAADSNKYGKYFSLPSGSDSIITIENNVALIQMSSRGGNIRKIFLKKFNNWYSDDKSDNDIYNTKVQLINYSRSDAYDLSFVTNDGKAVNTGSLDFISDAQKSSYKISPKDSLVLKYSLNTTDGKSIQKVYTFYGDGYGIKSDVIFNGMNNLISNNEYDILWSNGIREVEENSVDEANYSNASVYYGDEQVIINADNDQKQNKDFNGKVDWLAVRNKYFTAIIIPQNPAGVNGAYIEGSRKVFSNHGIKEKYNLGLTMPFKNSTYEKNTFTLYVGPVDYGNLKHYGRNLEKIVDFGSFFGLKFIVRPIAEYVMLPLFNFLHMFIPNYGFVIVVFSLIIKVVLHPLTKQSMQSMKKMQLLQPKITELKEKYKDDPQKMNKETMKLYSTYGINPAGGCLPLLLQMPIFIALYGLFQTAIDLRHQPFIFWIHDLSRPDVIFDLGFKLPLFGVDKISALALLMGITQFVQQKMTVKDPSQKALVYMMPIMFTIMFMSFPSGLNLYYFMFNLFSIAQQYYINHKHDGMVLEPVKNPKKSKGFMQKLMDSAEASAKVQQQQKKKK
jgi:YidC/Oxa1 family membrane protein insertase